MAPRFKAKSVLSLIASQMLIVPAENYAAIRSFYFEISLSISKIHDFL